MEGSTKPPTKRVVFGFDQKNLEILEDLKTQGNFRTLAEAVRASLQINRVLHEQRGEGFTEIVLRNPRNNKEKTLIIPSLHSK